MFHVSMFREIVFSMSSTVGLRVCVGDRKVLLSSCLRPSTCALSFLPVVLVFSGKRIIGIEINQPIYRSGGSLKTVQ